MRRLVLSVLSVLVALVALGCAGAPPKPGCEPGRGTAVAALCKLEMEQGTATLAECDARVSAWEAGCLR